MKKLLSILLINFFTCQQINAQSVIDSTAIKYAETITVSELKEHLYVIASDSMGGRNTGSAEQQKAADYIIKDYKSNKLISIVGNSSYLQDFNVSEFKWDKPTIKIDNKDYSFIDDFYGFPAMITDQHIDLDEIIFSGYGIESENYSDFNNVDVSGKAVIVLSGEPMSTDSIYFVTGTTEKSRFTSNFGASMRTKQQIAGEKGAKLLMIVDQNYEANSRRYGTYARMPSMSLPTKMSSLPNLIFISPDMAKAILGKRDLNKVIDKILKKKKSKSLKIKTATTISLNKNDTLLQTANILAYLEGTDLKDDVLVVTSHYDHVGTTDGEVYNGADDDGSGTVGVLEIAEAFAIAKSEGHGPRRSILFMNVSGEEKGLLGSEYYTSNPVVPLENTIANLNIDMIGRVDVTHTQTPEYVYVIGSNRLSSELHEINESANATYTNLILDYKYNAKDDPNRFYFRSDHYNFAKNNVPVIFYFNGVHEDYHQPSDTPDKINYEVLSERAKLIFYTSWQLANQDKRIEVDMVNNE